MYKSSLRILRVVALLEGISFLVLLLIAMPLKYYGGIPSATQMVGMAHGVLFVAYIFFVIVVAILKKWSFLTVIILIILSFVPAGTFYADKKYFRKP